MITGEKSQEGGEGDWEKLGAARQQWDSIEKCEKAAEQNFEKLYAVMRECPDARLKETVWLPYDGGRDFTIEEVMDYPRWNCNYHAGQIAYMQTLYGDKKMT